MGRDKKLFRFYKFRTMYSDAKDRFPKLYRYNYTDKQSKTLKFKLKNDPRLTILGKKLRRTSLDEIPNLINVIKGDMYLVGPRPEIPEMLKYYRKNQLLKFNVKPGITGYAQTNGRSFLTLQETISLDLKYLKEQSFSTDFKILLKTIIVVLRGIGAF
jgi:lipopolysaccharide/colanic/teichoic acid biosynthesis glycosyltransferase